jgi:hypothetical protein
VKFSPSSDGTTQITVTFTDGSVKQFDEQGNDLDADDAPGSSTPSAAPGNNT